MSKLTKKQITERDEARENLRVMFEKYKVDTIYTVMRHCSSSCMYRVIDLFIIGDNRPLRISWTAAVAMSDKYDRKHEGIGIGGCGMDMGFALVNNLSISLYCPTEYTHEGAYKLNHNWL